MDDKSGALKFLVIRLLISIPFFVLGILLMTPVSAKSIIGVFTLAIGAFLLAKPIVDLLTSSAGSILFPTSPSREVIHLFSIAESRIMEKKYDEALVLYQKMIPKDPGRLEIYMRIMNLAVYQMKQPRTAEDAFRTGKRNLTRTEDQKTLADQYKRLMDLRKEEAE
ncbi:MAG: hypothetical protein K8S62_12465 [Candidatus Sabulitectum sp.]|nr:hypothetical protein [Candidatus Sabulitectum sp.]